MYKCALKIDEFWPLFLSRTPHLGSPFDTLNVFSNVASKSARTSSTQKSCNNNNNNNNRLRSHHTVVVFMVVVGVPLEMEEMVKSR